MRTRKSKNTHVIMDKKRVNILLTLLEAVAQKFPEINDECLKASMSEEEVIFCKS